MRIKQQMNMINSRQKLADQLLNHEIEDQKNETNTEKLDLKVPPKFKRPNTTINLEAENFFSFNQQNKEIITQELKKIENLNNVQKEEFNENNYNNIIKKEKLEEDINNLNEKNYSDESKKNYLFSDQDNECEQKIIENNNKINVLNEQKENLFENKMEIEIQNNFIAENDNQLNSNLENSEFNNIIEKNFENLNNVEDEDEIFDNINNIKSENAENFFEKNNLNENASLPKIKFFEDVNDNNFFSNILNIEKINTKENIYEYENNSIKSNKDDKNLIENKNTKPQITTKSVQLFDHINLKENNNNLSISFNNHNYSIKEEPNNFFDNLKEEKTNEYLNHTNLKTEEKPKEEIEILVENKTKKSYNEDSNVSNCDIDLIKTFKESNIHMNVDKLNNKSLNNSPQNIKYENDKISFLEFEINSLREIINQYKRKDLEENECMLKLELSNLRNVIKNKDSENLLLVNENKNLKKHIDILQNDLQKYFLNINNDNINYSKSFITEDKLEDKKNLNFSEFNNTEKKNYSKSNIFSIKNF